MLPDSLFEGIKMILKKAEFIDDRTDRHKNVQTSLLNLLRELGFVAMKEYRITHRSIYRSKGRFSELKQREGGLIDVYGTKQDDSIAIEFDNSGSSKWKSIEKLLQCDAEHCLGLCIGPKREEEFDFYYRKNKLRIRQVFIELVTHYIKEKEFEKLHSLLSKIFWLGIISMDVFEEINLTDLLKSTHYSLD